MDVQIESSVKRKENSGLGGGNHNSGPMARSICRAERARHFGIGSDATGSGFSVSSAFGSGRLFAKFSMHIRCPHCSTNYSWIRPACPRCWRPNGRRPAMLAWKLLVVIASCVLIALLAKAVITASDDSSAAPGSGFWRDLFSPPTPAPQPGPVFRDAR